MLRMLLGLSTLALNWLAFSAQKRPQPLTVGSGATAFLKANSRKATIRLLTDMLRYVVFLGSLLRSVEQTT